MSFPILKISATVRHVVGSSILFVQVVLSLSLKINTSMQFICNNQNMRNKRNYMIQPISLTHFMSKLGNSQKITLAARSQKLNPDQLGEKQTHKLIKLT